jgi:GT2 family glycosyltransferase
MTSSATESGIVRGQSVPHSPRVSVIVLVTASTEHLRECLNALRRPGCRVESMEIVIVANGTPEAQLEYLRSCDDIVLVVNEINVGFASGCNQAASVARGPLLLFLNDDSIVQEGCIEALVRACTSDPAIGAVGSRIISPDGTLEEAGSLIWRDGSATHVGEGTPCNAGQYLHPRWVDYASANGLLVLRTVWDEVGGFDERYFPAYFEDVDFCLSLGSRGYGTRYEPTAVLVHRGSQSSSTVYRNFLLTRNHLRLVEKWGQALERFDPAPAKDSGSEFESAVGRAVGRGRNAPSVFSESQAATPKPSDATSFDPRRATEELQAEYLLYLENRVAVSDQRILSLDAYLRKLWGVRFRRWLAGRIARTRSGVGRPTSADTRSATRSITDRPNST